MARPTVAAGGGESGHRSACRHPACRRFSSGALSRKVPLTVFGTTAAAERAGSLIGRVTGPLAISGRRIVTATAARLSSRRLPGGSGSGRAGRPVIPARTQHWRAAPGSRPSAADGEHRLRRGGAAACPGPAFPGPPGWPRRLWCQAAALRRTAGARVLQYSSDSSAPTRSTGPATRTWRCAGTSQCSTAAARGLAASSAPLSLSQSVALTVGEEDQPTLQAAQHHQAGRGNSVAGCARDGHGFRHRLAGRAGRVQPRGELTQRVGVQVGGIHPPSLAPPRGCWSSACAFRNSPFGSAGHAAHGRGPTAAAR